MTGLTLAALRATALTAPRKNTRKSAMRAIVALETAYAAARQARRETVSLMARLPHDGRPPTAFTGGSGVAVNGQGIRAGRQWQSTARAAWPAHWRADDGVRVVGLPLWFTTIHYASGGTTAELAARFPLHVETLTAASGPETPRKARAARAPRVNPSAARMAAQRAAAHSTHATARHDFTQG